ncbi:MAG: hypothetical protein AAB444_01460 [Patescibacteria group bacterium]
MKTKLIVFIIVILFSGNIALGSQYFWNMQELVRTRALVRDQRFNDAALQFAKLFINEVINTEQTVDFETRLRLENAVRALKDEEVLAQWLAFVNSADEGAAQREVRALLQLLMKKIRV